MYAYQLNLEYNSSQSNPMFPACGVILQFICLYQAEPIYVQL